MRDPAKVVAGFVSFTEVTRPDEHDAYNRWHLLDHLPEQLPLPGIAWGQRWVLTPALRALSIAEPPLDRVHYVTLYLLAEPLEETLTAFLALGQELHRADRFHLHRRSHLSGPLRVAGAAAAPRVLVSPAAVPYRPAAGVHVRVERATSPTADLDDLVGIDGVAGAWGFAGDARLSPPAVRDLAVTWCWLDDDPAAVAPRLRVDSDALFVGTLETIDPRGPWDWFAVDAP